MTPFLFFYHPEPVGWYGLTPDELRVAQSRARDVLGAPNVSDEPTSRAQQAELVTAADVSLG